MTSRKTTVKKKIRQVVKKKNVVGRKSPGLRSPSFSDVEDAKNSFKTIGNIASRAGKNAATEARTKGLDITYVRNNKKLVRVSPAGKETALTPKIKKREYYTKSTPNTVLHAVEK